MIGLIRGIILEKQPPMLLVEAHSVGYEIDAPMSTFYQLPEIGQETTLFTHLVVREDAHHLYGFYSREERTLFRTLLKVNGVGPRLGLTILSSADPEDFVRSILNNDTQSLVRLPGVGKKTAERLIIEMRDKLAEWKPLAKEVKSGSCEEPSGINANNRQQILQDAISALVALGYKQLEANRAVTKIDDGNASSERLIRNALREMA